jgi:hypothetical protein
MSFSNESEQTRDAVTFNCLHCSMAVEICRSCWRNQRYCSTECKALAFIQRNQSRQKRYRGTPAGIQAHKEAQKRYRANQKKPRLTALPKT